MKKGYMYILECSDGSYYTGSTTNLELRLQQHQSGEGANHTKKRLPVILVYYEEYSRIDEAFYREKQVQGWSRKKKEALINGNPQLLPQLAVALTETIRQNATIDWTIKESAKAKLKVSVKRLLRKYGYPPDMQMLATETVLKQAEMIANELTLSS